MRTGLRINIIFDSFDVRVEVGIGSRKESIQSVSIDRLAGCSLISHLLVALLGCAQHFVHIVAMSMKFACCDALVQAFNSNDDIGINTVKP
jgi:hypothetical protein